MPNYISVRRISENLGCSIQNTVRFIDDGKLKGKKEDPKQINSPYQITVFDYEEFIRARASALRDRADELLACLNKPTD